MKKRMLYIGHPYHLKTRSTQFLIELFQSEYLIDTVFFDDEKKQFYGEYQDIEYDVLVLFQMPVPPDIIRPSFRYKTASYFPMYDGTGEASNKFWGQYCDFNIINFSRTLHERLLKLGLNSHYIQYFPRPEKVESWGDTKSVFFWPRTGSITINEAVSLLEELGAKHLHYHIAPDPTCRLLLPSKQDRTEFSITTSEWFDNKKDLNSVIQKSAYYIAPRANEGIGMSFLEAMAMGRCVIALDRPTMNEYIRDGDNGILYSLDDLSLQSNINVRVVQKAAYKYIEDGYKRWQRDKQQILSWILEQPPLILKKYYLNGHVVAEKRYDGEVYLLGKVHLPNRIFAHLKKVYHSI